jgi:hypothetical protein
MLLFLQGAHKKLIKEILIAVSSCISLSESKEKQRS